MTNFNSFEKKYFSLLKNRYPGRHEALAQVLLLESTLELPKPTEHFLSDLHGEYIAFTHVLRNASGVLRRYIDELFPEKSEEDKNLLATILYYPEKKLADLKEKMDEDGYCRLLKETLADLIVVAKRVATKYDHEQIESTLPPSRKKILNLLLLEDSASRHKKSYVASLYDNMTPWARRNVTLKIWPIFPCATWSKPCTLLATFTTAGKMRKKSWINSQETIEWTFSGAITTSPGSAPPPEILPWRPMSFVSPYGTMCFPPSKTATVLISCPSSATPSIIRRRSLFLPKAPAPTITSTNPSPNSTRPWPFYNLRRKDNLFVAIPLTT